MIADIKLERMGLIMEPMAGQPNEVEGVLNPAAVRGRDGQLYLFPRLVAKGNYSRIGIARVLFDKAGDPIGVERMGVVLEPEADYELGPNGQGGCEDPRVTFIEPLNHYVMTYTAFSSHGPRIAVAISEDLFTWRRVGLAQFHPYEGISFDGIDDKDASIFPVQIPDPSGRPSYALVHRPLFPGTRPEETMHEAAPRVIDRGRECIWISYCHIDSKADAQKVHQFVSHRKLACPAAPWEQLKIGGGAPPIMSPLGWLMFYHGVHDLPKASPSGHHLCYSAGALLLSETRPTHILYRSAQPALVPEGPLEMTGTVENVVFPTGVDRRDDLGKPGRFDVYYGMADDRIGAARFDMSEAVIRKNQWASADSD
jgi:predicted GH43/DUF377 family glycosyl hydrolase